MKIPKFLQTKQGKIIFFSALGGILVTASVTFAVLFSFSRDDEASFDDSTYEISTEDATEPVEEEAEELNSGITEQSQATATTNYVSSAETSGTTYYVEVNRQQNVVIVYSLDSAGYYSNIAQVFVASTGAPNGSETPLGTYTVTDRYESLYLVGYVWGRYAVRINGAYFFHSVPYFTQGPPWDNLEYEEYNKLGSGASAGCVRLAVRDAKWVYDNIGYGTTVKIYDSDTLPAGVTKPSAIKIDVNDTTKGGWDPTDPDPSSPWN